MTNHNKIIIGLYGLPGAGKDSVFNFIKAKEPGAEKVSFAEPLRHYCAQLMGEPYSRFTDPALKDTPHIFNIAGVPVTTTPREILIAVGTGFVRAIKSDLWIRKAEQIILSSSAPVLVFTDMRFPNEIEWLRNLDNLEDIRTVLVKVVRRGYVPPSSNAVSEGLLENYAYHKTLFAYNLIELEKEVSKMWEAVISLTKGDKREVNTEETR